MAPFWEALAEAINTAFQIETVMKAFASKDLKADESMKVPILIGKVDCDMHPDFCKEQKIQAYPTLRLFFNQKKYSDYHGDRTLLAVMEYLKAVEQQEFEEGGILHKAYQYAYSRMEGSEEEHKTTQVTRRKWIDDEHPGCQLSGLLFLDRVPGNFHIKARSNSHDLVPAMTNVSHEVHQMSFDTKRATDRIKNDDLVPKEII